MSIQNYYTKKDLAVAIGYHTKSNLYKSHQILDLCAGTGNLAHGVLTHFPEKPTVHFVEPDEEALPKLVKRRASIGRDQVYAMSAEEFALTHATPDMVNMVLCNPPFGLRCGRSALGELLRGMHLPQLEYFESYFLHLACEVARNYMCFILPDSYARKPEAETTLLHLAARGWNLARLRALPIDGFHDVAHRTGTDGSDDLVAVDDLTFTGNSH